MSRQAYPAVMARRLETHLVMVHHPDRGGDREQFEAIVRAKEAAEMELSA